VYQNLGVIDIEHRRVLVCPPDYFTVRDVKNPFMAGVQPVDCELAKRQWSALCDAFAGAGVTVEKLDAVDDLEDMVFAANQAFVGADSSGTRFIVPSAMRHPSRAREVPHYVRWFKQHGFRTIDLRLDPAAGEYLEGGGDLLWHPNHPHVWAGYGFRSTKAAVAKFAEAMEREEIGVAPLELVDETFYHLDTCLAPLSSHAALIHAPALSAEAVASLRRVWKRLHEVSREDALCFACNGVAVNGYFIASHVSDALSRIVRDEGLKPVIVDTSEFEKAGGSVFCLKSFLD
jgi:N-dimethylarginine dimethylaminohydrolase